MLNLIGLGLKNENSLTLEGLDTLKKSDKIYFEGYTSKWEGNIKNLEKMVNKKINILKRSDLEENSKEILREATINDISILILGDPLVATTHIILFLGAKKIGVKIRIIHNASIYSAVGETGLHLYKFGATVTIPFPEKTNDQLPTSIFKIIEENNRRNLHTLCLLDLISEEGKYMSPNEGMEIILKSDKIDENQEIIVFGRAGFDDSIIIYGKIKDLINLNFGNPPFVLIIPGKMHFTEKEYLGYYKVE